MSRKTNIAARFALLLATIIWGATFFILKNTIDEIQEQSFFDIIKNLFSDILEAIKNFLGIK